MIAIQYNNWEQINLSDFNSLFSNFDSTTATLGNINYDTMNLYQTNSSTFAGTAYTYDYSQTYDISVKASYSGSRVTITSMQISSQSSDELFSFKGKITYNINTDSFTQSSLTNLTYKSPDGSTSMSVTGVFGIDLDTGDLTGGTISQMNVQINNYQIEIKGNLITDSEFEFSGGTITSLSIKDADGNSFNLTGISLDASTVDNLLSNSSDLTDLLNLVSNYANAGISITGDESANIITGDIGKDILNGNGGDDVLDGGAGVDKLIGGAGDDTYIVDLVRTGTTAANYKVALQDTITETAVAGSGTDTVILRGTFTEPTTFTTLTLGANLENLDASLTADTKLNLTGNALANTLTGNDEDNILDGGAGVDTLIGGLGDDTYILDLKATAGVLSIEDTVVEFNSTTDGSDTIKLRGAVTLTEATTLSLDGSTVNTWSHVENIDASATGATKLNLTGSEIGNALIGNAAANIIDGGMGDDTLDGGAGNDTLISGLGNDTLKGGLGADIFKWTASDLVAPGDVSGNTDTITDFSIAQKDQLDLRDLLIDNTQIENYIDIVFESGSTHIRISSTGEFANGTYDDAKEDAHIVLSNLNLFTATKTAANNDAQLIGYLTHNNYLLTD